MNSGDTSSWENFRQSYKKNKMPQEEEFMKPCPKCEGFLLPIDCSNPTSQGCNSCRRQYKLLKCSYCSSVFRICSKCTTIEEVQRKIHSKPEADVWKCSVKYILPAAIVCFIAVCWVLNSKQFSHSQELPDVMKRLRVKFPSQKNVTLYHILSVLERSQPTVKSITLLHRNDMKTSNCLAEELVNIFDGNLNINEVRFNIDGFKFRDYGEILEHYHSIVKNFRVLVTNLNKVPASIARVFHSLCDEVASDIKPSLFIFILRENKETNMRPLEKATNILKQAWNDLPDSDLFPLLSRVVKNVVDVIPEKNVVC